ncbi:hypothetical protein LJY25_17155 [Hymenobacter sp. BT175]|uniref:hypothetical protein n=1 Tax=Hymenobacter translucens TaxID=2886507 RepID=UPI001D0E302E|nr:hypothetical protein [Hymenobacter translucens]MCC2548181.1 hypothetical protein [Hymenobacter translucens]
MLKSFLLSGLLTLACGQSIQAQTNPYLFDLQKVTLTVPASSYHVAQVVDARADRSRLGVVQRGIDNVPVSANFRQSLEAELMALFQRQLPPQPGSRPVVLRVHAFNISERTTAASEKATTELVVDYLVEQPDHTYQVLLSTGELVETGGIEVTSKHAATIGQALQQSLARLSTAPALAGPVLSLAEVTAGKGGAADVRFPIQTQPMRRGVYRSFEEFINNNPTLAEGPFEIVRRPHASRQWAGQDEVEAYYLHLDAAHPRRLVRDGAWGVSDGKAAYILDGSYYYEMTPSGQNYTFMTRAGANPDAVLAGALVGGLAGAVVVGAVSSGRPQQAELHLMTGRVVLGPVLGDNPDAIFAQADTAAIYLYRRPDARANQELTVTVDGQAVGTLPVNGFLALSWQNRRKEITICVQGSAPTCYAFVPDFSAPNFLECALPTATSTTPTLKPSPAKEGMFYVKKFRRRR